MARPMMIGRSARHHSAAAAAAKLFLDFTTGTLPSGVTASGGANGTALNSSGFWVPQAAPRFCCNPTALSTVAGLAVEPQNTNGTQYDFDNNWGGDFEYGNTPNADPFGGTYARGMHLDSQHYYYTFPNYVSGLNESTCFFKPVSPSPGGAFIYGDDRTPNEVSVDLNTLIPSALNGSPTNMLVTQEPNGFYRLSFTAVVNLDNCSMVVVSNGSGTGSVLVSGPQLVAPQSGISTPIAPSTEGNVQRTADVVTFTIPTGVSKLTYKFDDGSTQVVNVSPGAYTVPTTLNRTIVASITGS